MRQISSGSAITAAIPRKATRRRQQSIDRLIAIGLISPSILAIAVFVYGFIGFTGFSSFTKWDSLTPDFTAGRDLPLGTKHLAVLLNGGG